MADAVEGLLAKLAGDADFQDDLKQPQVIVAMKHWTGENRLSAEQAEKLMGDYRVLAVLQKISALQTACQRAGLPVPLDKVLRQETSLGLQTAAATATTTKANKATPEPKPQGGEGPQRRKPPARRAAASVPRTAASPPPQPSPQVQVPETVLGWLHLLSPLLMLLLGLVYFAYLQVAKK